MEDIYNIFLTQTMTDILDPESKMPEIRFVFDEKTLKEFESHLNIENKVSYQYGLKSIQYLCNVRQQYLDGKDELFIQVHDSDKFFSLLQKLVEAYRKKPYGGFKLLDSKKFIRSIWLRMSPSDIDDVEYFLKKQLAFLNSASRFYKGPQKLADLGDDERLMCDIADNEDWFETNENIMFKIIKDIGTEEEYPYLPISIEYNFPAIHFEMVRENGKPTCYIYGIQNLPRSLGNKNDEIKEELQPLRRQFRNPYVSADFIISLGLFLDYLYKHQIRDIEVSSLQVFNYPYHENLAHWSEEEFRKYNEEYRAHLDQLYESGKIDELPFNYRNIKRFENPDLISQNKTERFFHTITELMKHYPSIELISEPFVQSENMIIHLNGPINILDNVYSKKRTI